MVDDSFFDSFLTGGYLPGMRTVTVTSADGLTAAAIPLEARQEPITEEIANLAGVEAGTEVVVYFFPVDQAQYIRPRNKWRIDDSQTGEAWIITKDDLTIQARGVAVVATRDRR